MIILGLVIHLPFKVILSVGSIIVFGHNLLDGIEAAKDFKAGVWWDLLHHGNWSTYPYMPNHHFVIIYPFVP